VVRVSAVGQDRRRTGPLAGARVSAVGGNGKRLNGQTSRNGSVTLTTSPGTYRVQVTRDGYVPESFTIAVSSRGAAKSVLLKSRGTPPGPGEPPATTLNVRVVTSPGGEFGNQPIPIQGATVTTTSKGRKVAAGVTGKDGRFTARAPRGQVCSVRVEHPGYESTTRTVTAGSGGTTTVVLKARSSPGTPPDKPAKVELRLRVVDSSSNRTVDRASIKLLQNGRAVGAAIRETSPGTYIITLEPGVYRVQISKLGYAPKTLDVTVGKQGPVTKTVPLVPSLI
jgi:hypothetical protein